MAERTRRHFLKAGFLGGIFGWLANTMAGSHVAKLLPTPSEIKGPFHPITAQKDTDFDLTQVEGVDGVAKGKIVFIEGRIIDGNGNPIEDASVELWQANAAGRYAHPHDSNPAPLDSNFQGWAIVPSGTDGGFRFKTVIPGSYPAADDWTRPPHIHFKVSKLRYVELITQMYFPEQPLNAKDLLLQRKKQPEQKLMIAEKIKADEETYRYQIVLEKA